MVMGRPRTTSFSHITDYGFMAMTFVLSLTQILVLLSLYVILSIRLSSLVCGAAGLFCARCFSIEVSVPYAIAGSAQQLYTCLFRQLAMLLLKRSLCLAYATHPTMVLCCITYACSVAQVYTAFNVFYHHIVDVGWGCCLQPSPSCLSDVHLKTHSPSFIG